MVDLAQGQITPESKYEVKFVGGKIQVAASFDGAELDAQVAISYDALKLVNALVDAIEKAVPGDQGAMAMMVKQALAMAVAQAEAPKA